MRAARRNDGALDRGMTGKAGWHNGKTRFKKSARLAPAIVHFPRRISNLPRGMTHETAPGGEAVFDAGIIGKFPTQVDHHEYQHRLAA